MSRQSTEGSADGRGRDLRDPQHYELPLTKQGRLRLSDRLREFYLTPDEANGTCLTQAVGHAVYVWVWSDRRNVRVTLPVDGWLATRPYDQSIHRWSVSVNRYLAEGPDEAGVPIAGVTRDGRRLVDAEVQAVDAARPEVLTDG